MTRSKLNAVLGVTVWLVACNGTRTGNPYEHAPDYTTSSRFSADPPTRPTLGDSGGLTVGPWGGPAYQHAGGDLAALFEHYVALAVSGRGVLSVDVADPEAPAVVGELPLDGTIFELEPAADGVTVAVLERTELDVTELPEAPVPRAVPRLVRVDLRDPSQPRRAFDVDLEGALFGLDVRGEDVYVTQTLTEPRESSCGGSGGLLLGDSPSQPAMMKVTHYVASASGFEEREAVELASDVGGALVAGDSYLVVDGYQTDAPLVRWVDFASGSLVQGEPFEVTGQPRSADREGDLLALVLADGDASLSLALYSLEAGVARERGRVALPARDVAAVTLLASGAATVDGDGAPALLVDLADLDAPRVASQLPSEVMRLVEAPTGLLGLGSSGGPESSGDLVVSLWDASDVASPMQLSRVQTDWFYPTSDPGFESWTLDAERSLLLVPFARPGDEQSAGEGLVVRLRGRLGVFELDANGVTLHSEQALRTVLWRPWTDGESVFGLSHEGFEVVPLVQGAREPEPVSALLELWPGASEPIDELQLDGARVVLQERKDDGVFHVEVTADAGGEPAVLELPHRGDALVQVDDRVVVLGMRGVASECEYFAQQGVDSAGLIELVGIGESFDPCGPQRARGLSVVALDGEPRIVESLPFVSTMDVEPLDDVDVRAELDGYVPLDDGRILLLVQRMRQCNSYASCAELGVPAYESMATPGCGSDQDCSDQPSVITLVSGYENTLVVYVLDGVGTAAPTLSLGASLDGQFELADEGPLDVRRTLLSSEGTLAFAREEPVYGDDGNSITDDHGEALVRFFLDRVVLHDDGRLEALPPVSTPGLPIALRGEMVFCLEPRYDDEASIAMALHRAGLHGRGAFIESSVELGTGFVAAHVQGGHAYALRYLGDPCLFGTRTELSAVPLAAEGELERGDGLELPGVFWRFAPPQAGDQDTLRLAGGPHPDGLLGLELGDPARPRVARYLTPTPQ